MQSGGGANFWLLSSGNIRQEAFFFFCLSGTGRDDPWLVEMDRDGHEVHIQAKYCWKLSR